MNFFEKLGIAIFAIPITALLMYFITLYSVLSYGYVINLIWPWFISSDMITYVPGFWESVGIYFMINVLFKSGIYVNKSKFINDESCEIKDYSTAKYLAVLNPWFLLFIAYIIKNHFFFW